ncbi:hypothetical protein GCM10027037_01220 [Mucilaginibacter koreensis]
MAVIDCETASIYVDNFFDKNFTDKNVNNYSARVENSEFSTAYPAILLMYICYISSFKSENDDVFETNTLLIILVK